MTHRLAVNAGTGTITDETLLHIVSNGLSAAETTNMDLASNGGTGLTETFSPPARS